MTPGDIARVLTKLAAFDNRTIGDADVAVWHEVLGHLDLSDALDAVTAHYREQSSRAMPADIRKLAIGIRDRRKEGQHLALPAGPTVRDRSPEVAELVRGVVDSLPKPDLHERARQRARAERGRAPTELRRKRPTKQHKKRDLPKPADAATAALARQYLRDGHDPEQIADTLGISRRWCQRQQRDLNANPAAAAAVVARQLHRQVHGTDRED